MSDWLSGVLARIRKDWIGYGLVILLAQFLRWFLAELLEDRIFGSLNQWLSAHGAELVSSVAQAIWSSPLLQPIGLLIATIAFILGHAYWHSTREGHRLPPSIAGPEHLTFGELAERVARASRGSSWGLSSDEAFHRIMVAFWRGAFEDEDENSRVLFPSPEGGTQHGGSGPAIYLDRSGEPTLDPPMKPASRRLALAFWMKPIPMVSLPKNKELLNEPWETLRSRIPFEELCRVPIASYHETARILFASLVIERADAVRWFREFRRGKHEVPPAAYFHSTDRIGQNDIASSSEAELQGHIGVDPKHRAVVFSIENNGPPCHVLMTITKIVRGESAPLVRPQSPRLEWHPSNHIPHFGSVNAVLFYAPENGACYRIPIDRGRSIDIPRGRERRVDFFIKIESSPPMEPEPVALRCFAMFNQDGAPGFAHYERVPLSEVQPLL